MTATPRRQQRAPLALVGQPHAATDRRPYRRPRPLTDLYDEVNEQLCEKQLQLSRVREQQQHASAAVHELHSRMMELERQIQHDHHRLALLRSGRFFLVLALPFRIRLRILQEQMWHCRTEISKLYIKQQRLSAAIRRLEGKCRSLEVRRVLLQAQLRRHADRAKAHTRSRQRRQRRQRPHHP